MEFSRQEYWSGLPLPPLGDFPNPGIKLGSPALAAGFFTTSGTWEAPEEIKALRGYAMSQRSLDNTVCSALALILRMCVSVQLK